MRCITVSIYDDSRVENDEYFTLSIRDGGRTQITEERSVRITIRENDSKLQVIANQ